MCAVRSVGKVMWTMPVELSIVEAAFVLTMVGLGALIQGSLGFGFAFAVAPALALIRPEAVPTTIVLLSIPMVALMAIRERGSIYGLVAAVGLRLAIMGPIAAFPR